VVKLFEGDVRARKRLAELLVSEPDVRLAIINAVLRDVATRSDMEALRKELEALRAATKSDMEALKIATRSDMEALRKELKSDIEALRGELRDNVKALRKELKSDIEALRKELKSDVEYLRRDVSELRERASKLEGAFTQLVDRMGDLDKRIDYTTKVSWALTISVLATLAAQLILMFLRIH
jgi:predicted nuclease with TOPRIM domain